MFKRKLEENLLYCVKRNIYKKYRVLIKYNNFSDKIISKIEKSNGTVYSSLKHICLICAEVKSLTLNRLIEMPEVTYVCFDDYCHICASPIGIEPANGLRFSHNYKLCGKNISIALIDTGVYPHKDLTEPVNRIIYFNDIINNIHYPYDDNGHGTFIAGIMCGSGLYCNNMYKGLATKSNLYVYKCFDAKGKGFVSDILYALDIIIDMYEEANIKIICLAAEYLSYNSFIINAFNDMFKKCCDKNIIVVVPSGSSKNSDCSIKGFATSKYCFTIGGYDTYKTDKPYEYSSSGPYLKLTKPEFVAAASNITSLNSDVTFVSERRGIKLYPSKLEKLYTVYSGTSCSSAYICSIIALLFEDNINLTFNDILSLFKLSAVSPDINKEYVTKNMVGYGLIDPKQILK